MILKEEDLENILSQAKQAVSTGRCFFGVDSHDLIEEFINLRMGDTKEIWPLVLKLLHEIQPNNYTPPTKTTIAGDKLFSFIWKSSKMKKRMQIQFTVNKGIFYYFSLRTKKSIKRK